MPKEENGLLSIILQSDIAWITANFQNIEAINQYGRKYGRKAFDDKTFCSWNVCYNLHEA